MDKVITRCPLCGGNILVSYLYQTSYTYKVGRNGKLCKKPAYVDRNNSMDVSIAMCENYPSDNCTAHWEEDDFWYNDESGFLDYKYSKEE